MKKKLAIAKFGQHTPTQTYCTAWEWIHLASHILQTIQHKFETLTSSKEKILQQLCNVEHTIQQSYTVEENEASGLQVHLKK
jgi:hypothetical protein